MKGIKVRVMITAACLGLSINAHAAPVRLPKTGMAVTGMQRFEKNFESFLKEWQVPGAALSVRNAAGEVVYARGFGWADKNHQVPVRPDAQFRIADISQLFTAVAIMQLVEQGRLRLDDHVTWILSNLKLPKGAKVDKRVAEITLRDLLENTPGWDSKHPQGIDPTAADMQQKIAASLKVPLPLSCQARARYMFSQPLQYQPGTHISHDDISYCLLGLVVARVTGQPYGAASYMRYLREHILRPLHLEGVQLGQTLAKQRAPLEVLYYPYQGESPAPSLLVGRRGQLLPKPYGGSYYLPHYFASKGLVASAIDLSHFAYDLDHGKLLRADSVRILHERPKAVNERNHNYTAKGMRVYREGSRFAWAQEGRLAGSAAYVTRRTDGTYWAVLFNSLPKEQTKFYRAYKALLEPGVVRVVSLAAQAKHEA